MKRRSSPTKTNYSNERIRIVAQLPVVFFLTAIILFGMVFTHIDGRSPYENIPPETQSKHILENFKFIVFTLALTYYYNMKVKHIDSIILYRDKIKNLKSNSTAYKSDYSKMTVYEDKLLKKEKNYWHTGLGSLAISLIILASIFIISYEHDVVRSVSRYTFEVIAFFFLLFFYCHLRLKHTASINMYREKIKEIEQSGQVSQSLPQQILATLRSPDMIIDEILDSKYHSRPLNHRITEET